MLEGNEYKDTKNETERGNGHKRKKLWKLSFTLCIQLALGVNTSVGFI